MFRFIFAFVVLLFASNLYAQNGIKSRPITGTVIMMPVFTMPRNVGYAPLIMVLPEGTNFGVNAVVSGDRRYVRMGFSPMFSTITSVHTFNMSTGAYKRVK